jgi:threonine/homoserine/homoserine lactone efflux protein
MDITATEFLQALVAGFACGFIVSIPVGPVNLTVINHALYKGFSRAFLVGLGAACAETFYATVLLAGHSSVLDKPVVRDVLRVVALVVIVVIALRSLLLKPKPLEASEVTAEKVDERWHHPRAFLLGFVLTISNLMLVVLWATLSAVLFAREWVQPAAADRAACSAGVLLGCSLWFFLLAWFVSRAHRRINPRTVLLLMRACGVVLLVFAALLAYKLFASTPLLHIGHG